MIKIPGEYIRVSQRTEQWDLLRKAHHEGISQTSAKALVKLLSDYHNIKVPTIVFRRGSWGKWNTTWRMTLPKEPMEEGDTNPYGKLRVGIVLHEMAHFINFSKRGKNHDWQFVMILDELVELYYSDEGEK